MKTRLFLKLLFHVALVVLPLQPLSAQIGNKEACGILELYDRLLPKTVTGIDAAGSSEVVVLRYIPGDTNVEHEYRIVLFAGNSKPFRAIRTEPVGSSIQSQVRLSRGADDPPCDIQVTRVRLESSVLTDQAILRRILSELHAIRMRAEVASELYLDAPRYEVAIQSGMNEASWVLYGPSAHPLIRWFKRAAAELSENRTRPRK